MTVYVLDFDNVVVRGSEERKARAWREVFASHGPRALSLFAEAESLYGRGKGGDRFDIARHVFAGLGINGADLESAVAETSTRFDSAVQEYVRETGIEVSDREAIEAMGMRGAVYVNSATPVEALADSIGAIAPGLFAGSLGRPKGKVENLREIASREQVSPEEIVFVGDSDSDWRAAEEFGCRFFGLATSENGWKKEGGQPFRVIARLQEAVEE